MTDQAIILAGGKGTRLRDVVPDRPKPMAEVAGKPFLQYVLDEMAGAGIRKAVLSVGYRHEVIRDFFQNRYRSIELVYAVEEKPLGTGGAVKYAAQWIDADQFCLVNGDTLYRMDWQAFGRFHAESGADISVALKQMENPDRYGTVQLDGDRISAFREKETGLASGWINAGVYQVNRAVFDSIPGDVFSFEENILQAGIETYRIMGWKTDGYFIDIGIPDDYRRANEDFKEAGH